MALHTLHRFSALDKNPRNWQRLPRAERLEDRRLLAVTVIDFESLETPGASETVVGLSYMEDGFQLTSGRFGFESPQTENPNWFAGSTALYDNTIDGRIQLVATDGGVFDLTSIDLSRASLTIDGGAIVRFTGTKADSSTVSQSFTVGFDLAFDTFSFSGFEDLVSVSWFQERPFHQFDNIVLSTNESPEAMDDVAEMDEDGSVLINVVANDFDADGNLDPTTATVTKGPENGSIINHGDGVFTYTPNADFFGTDTFEYEVCDEKGECSAATVEITVNPVVDAQIQVQRGGRIKLGSNGTTKITILSTQDDGDAFDATTVDLAIITFKINDEAVTPTKVSLKDVDRDGDLDLVARFNNKDLADILTEDSKELRLSAEYNGAAIGDDLEGTAAIDVVSSHHQSFKRWFHHFRFQWYRHVWSWMRRFGCRWG